MKEDHERLKQNHYNQSSGNSDQYIRMRDAERQVEKLKEDNWKFQTQLKEKEKIVENLEFKINEMQCLERSNLPVSNYQEMTQRINTPGFGDELLKKRHRNKSADTFNAQVSHANSQSVLNLRPSTSNLHENNASVS